MADREVLLHPSEMAGFVATVSDWVCDAHEEADEWERLAKITIGVGKRAAEQRHAQAVREAHLRAWQVHHMIAATQVMTPHGMRQAWMVMQA